MADLEVGTIFRTYKPLSALELAAHSMTHEELCVRLQEERLPTNEGYTIDIQMLLIKKDPEGNIVISATLFGLLDGNPFKGVLQDNEEKTFKGTFEIISEDDLESAYSSK